MGPGVTDPSRVPVVIGTAQLRANPERSVEGAREPLALLLEVARGAAADAVGSAAQAESLLAMADDVSAVRTVSWTYDDLARRLARDLGAEPRTAVDVPIGGQWPVRLVDAAAARIAAGDSTVALVVGGEAQASVTALGRAGVDPVTSLGWSADPGGPPRFDPADLGTERMHAAGLVLPARIYPLFENRLQADLGLTPEENTAESAELYAAFSDVAAANSYAWKPQRRTAAEIATPGPGNRMVCEPYPLAMNAMPHVDQAAAVLLTSLAVAHGLGIPDDRVVHVWAGAGCDDTADLLDRGGYGHSAALADVLDRTLDAAGVAADALDLLDVYSCFPVVPKLAARHLGLPRSVVPTVTGGHSSFGGPLNSYSLHAVATTAQRLRDERTPPAPPRFGLVHANGGYLTAQHAVLLGADPAPEGYVGQPEPTRIAPTDLRSADVRELLAERGTCEVVVETATVEHGRDGRPAQAFVIGRTDDGVRTALASAPGDPSVAAALSLSALPAGAVSHVGRRVTVTATDGGPVLGL